MPWIQHLATPSTTTNDLSFSDLTPHTSSWVHYTALKSNQNWCMWKAICTIRAQWDMHGHKWLSLKTQGASYINSIWGITGVLENKCCQGGKLTRLRHSQCQPQTRISNLHIMSFTEWQKVDLPCFITIK